MSLLKGAPNPRAVYSSKAVGEPPLFLASSILFAIKEAIKDARREEGLSEKFQLISPATSARIRMACQDRFTKMVCIEISTKEANIHSNTANINFICIFSFSLLNQNLDHIPHGM